MKNQNIDKGCDCEEMSCKENCGRNHTHKGFWCEKCHPERYTGLCQDREEKIKRAAEDFANRFEGVMKDLAGLHKTRKKVMVEATEILNGDRCAECLKPFTKKNPGKAIPHLMVYLHKKCLQKMIKSNKV